MNRVRDALLTRPIIYGNVAVPLPTPIAESQHTHEWTAYVRGIDDEDDISVFVDHVVFVLHPSFEDHMKEVREPPFELTMTGWGEFELVMKIHFKDLHEPPVELYHPLKLYPNEEKPETANLPVVSEQYDELIFNEPAPDLYQILSQQQQQQQQFEKQNKNSEKNKNKNKNKNPSQKLDQKLIHQDQDKDQEDTTPSQEETPSLSPSSSSSFYSERHLSMSPSHQVSVYDHIQKYGPSHSEEQELDRVHKAIENVESQMGELEQRWIIADSEIRKLSQQKEKQQQKQKQQVEEKEEEEESSYQNHSSHHRKDKIENNDTEYSLKEEEEEDFN